MSGFTFGQSGFGGDPAVPVVRGNPSQLSIYNGACSAIGERL